ncbi:MAG: alpha/beta hydrolase, partial [Limisphaerales bacterium]
MQSFSEIIRNRHGERLDYAFHPTQGEARGLVILGHGVTGNKDRPLLIALAEALEASGFSVLRFSFSGNGLSEGHVVDS